MATYRITMEVEIDEDLLRRHNGDSVPPPNDINAWQATDVFTAHRRGILSPTTEGIEAERIGG